MIAARPALEPIPSPRMWFGLGCRGSIIQSIQQRLRARRCYKGDNDGIYGEETQRGVFELQSSAQLPTTGAVDDATWRALMNFSPPTLFARVVQLTASLENHGFGGVRGNWDGAWLTWGILGFTLESGDIARILLEVDAENPGTLEAVFGNGWRMLAPMLSAGPSEQKKWANSISDGGTVKEPWRQLFEHLGDQEIVQAMQLKRARSGYFVPAIQTAASYGLETERGVALAFDIHVQNGGIHEAARSLIQSRVRFAGAMDEPSRRIIIANAVADAAKPQFREDVRCRKLAIATGEGVVHGQVIRTGNWGLAEYPALDARQERRT
jgi:hypothetical protein